MDPKTFEAELQKAGFQEIATRILDPSPANDEHTHDCTIRGLVTSGEFIVTSDGMPRSYHSGEIFEVQQGVRHSEAIGADGATVIVGRLFATS